MENKSTEPAKKEPSVLLKVRDRVVAFHDTHFKINSLAEHVVERFNMLAPEVASQKGKRVVEWLRPKIADVAKYIEVSAAAADVITGTIAAGIGGVGLTDAIAGRMRLAGIEHGNPKGPSREVRGPRIKSSALWGVGGATVSGVLLGLRPMTRLTDSVLRYSMPLASRVVRVVDDLLLRREKKQMVHRVYVGQARAT